jgi:hypothetical protein
MVKRPLTWANRHYPDTSADPISPREAPASGQGLMRSVSRPLFAPVFTGVNTLACSSAQCPKFAADEKMIHASSNRQQTATACRAVPCGKARTAASANEVGLCGPTGPPLLGTQSRRHVRRSPPQILLLAVSRGTNATEINNVARSRKSHTFRTIFPHLAGADSRLGRS